MILPVLLLNSGVAMELSMVKSFVTHDYPMDSLITVVQRVMHLCLLSVEMKH